jgi:hypothetical protein
VPITSHDTVGITATQETFAFHISSPLLVIDSEKVSTNYGTATIDSPERATIYLDYITAITQ